MKKNILIFTGLVVLATWVCAEVVQIKNTGTGYLIGTTATQKVGAFGATPVVQPSGAAQAAVATTGASAVTVALSPSVVAGSAQVLLTNQTMTVYVGLTSGDAVTNAIDIVTNVTVSPVFGFASSQATITTVVGSPTVGGGKYGYTTSAQADAIVTLVNAIRSALVSLGWIKGAS